jgi:hypothetical protein
VEERKNVMRWDDNKQAKLLEAEIVFLSDTELGSDLRAFI